MTKKTYRNYIVGIILSIILAAGIASLAITAITSSMGWGIIILVNTAIWFGGPLVCLILIVWLIYMVRDRGRVPVRVHALLFLPPLFSLLIYPASLLIEQRQHDQFRAANPPISETHVNLSGKELQLDMEPYVSSNYTRTQPSPPLSENPSGRFMSFTRYPNSDYVATGAFPYEGRYLKDDSTEYNYRVNAEGVATSLPMNRLDYPDLTPFFSTQGKDAASMLTYIYFHYPDHVDVAPALQRLALMTEAELDEKKQEGLVLFRAQNYTSGAIVRLEINGQMLDIGERALKSLAPRPQPCSSYIQRVGIAFVDLNQPLNVRWQTLNEPQTWHSATVHIPDFRQAQPMPGQSTLLRAQLYFLPDGTVEGERFVEVRSSKDHLGIRATGMPTRAARYASCGSAYSGYNPQTVMQLIE